MSDYNELFKKDFVVVQVSARALVVNYVARIDTADNVEYEGIFLWRVPSKVGARKEEILVFVPNEDDGAKVRSTIPATFIYCTFRTFLCRKALPTMSAGRFTVSPRLDYLIGTPIILQRKLKSVLLSRHFLNTFVYYNFILHSKSGSSHRQSTHGRSTNPISRPTNLAFS